MTGTAPSLPPERTSSRWTEWRRVGQALQPKAWIRSHSEKAARERPRKNRLSRVDDYDHTCRSYPAREPRRLLLPRSSSLRYQYRQWQLRPLPLSK